jgi:hypothetical protein
VAGEAPLRGRDDECRLIEGWLDEARGAAWRCCRSLASLARARPGCAITPATPPASNWPAPPRSRVKPTWPCPA